MEWMLQAQEIEKRSKRKKKTMTASDDFINYSKNDGYLSNVPIL